MGKKVSVILTYYPLHLAKNAILITSVRIMQSGPETSSIASAAPLICFIHTAETRIYRYLFLKAL